MNYSKLELGGLKKTCANALNKIPDWILYTTSSSIGWYIGIAIAPFYIQHCTPPRKDFDEMFTRVELVPVYIQFLARKKNESR